MFKVKQVVAIKEPVYDDPEYIQIAALVGTRIIPTNADGDPRIFYREDELRPLTQEEIEGA